MSANRRATLVYLFTTFPPEVSGSAQYNWERVVWLARQGDFKVHVLAPDCQDPGRFPRVPAGLEDSLFLEALPSKPWLLYNIHYNPTRQALARIDAYLRTCRPDLITVVDAERFFLFNTWQLPGLRYARQARVPYLTEFMTDYYNFSSTYPGGTLVRDITFRPMIRYLYSQFDTTLAPSRFAAQVMENMGVGNTRYVPFFGSDLSSYSPQHRDRRVLDPWLGQAERDNKVILYVGRLSFEKRLDLLIEAFASIQARRPGFSLVIAGNGPDDAVAQLKRQAARMANVHFTGFVHGQQKAALYASCDVFCSPGPYETFGRTVVEAMASGIPVVTVNSGAVAENIEDGQTGYLVAKDDQLQLSQVLERVALADNRRIIDNALRSAQHLTVEHGCRHLNVYYHELLQLPVAQPQPGPPIESKNYP